MALNDLLQVFWRRKLLIVLVTLAVILPAYGATKLVSPRYESTATLALSPRNLNNDLFLLSTLDAIVPVYADAATSRTTLEAAAAALGRPLADVTVETFKGSGIIKIKARSTSRVLAKESADAATQALLQRTTSGEIGIPALKLTEIDSAALPTSAVFPRTKLTLFVAALLGLALGLVAAFLRESLTTKIESSDDLARVSGLPVYAEIPAEAGILKLHSPEDLLLSPRLRIVAEAFRDLRTNLLFSHEGVRSIVITSPDGSHGKTTVAFGLAATLARAGTKTLLIDGDLRRGRVAQMLELDRSPGLTEVLLDEFSVEEALRSTTEHTLEVLPGGRRGGDPGELLTTKFPALLAWLEKHYEAIVIDSTPVIPISDARITARYADATILVARVGTARRRQVRKAIERLELISVKPTAAVLNYSQAVGSSSYYVRPGADDAEQLPAGRFSRARGAVSR
jgi:capsular exopolysaccharide synthesis family protein